MTTPRKQRIINGAFIGFTVVILVDVLLAPRRLRRLIHDQAQWIAQQSKLNTEAMRRADLLR